LSVPQFYRLISLRFIRRFYYPRGL